MHRGMPISSFAAFIALVLLNTYDTLARGSLRYYFSEVDDGGVVHSSCSYPLYDALEHRYTYI